VTDGKILDDQSTAVDLVREVFLETQNVRLPSEAALDTLVTAVAQDLAVTANTALSDQARLTKVEAQTHALAEAVIAISEVSVGIAPTIEAVKTEM
jgi:hypothetical protein